MNVRRIKKIIKKFFTSSVKSEIEPDEIYNLGAQSHVKVSFDIPIYTSDIIGIGNLKLLEEIKEWNPHGKKLSKIQFFRVFNKAHKVKRTNTTRYYNLNQGAFNLEKEIMDEAKKFDKRYRKKIKEKNKQKIKSKIPSITA